MSDSPFFSIIVPVYNDEKFICAALDSIVAQTDPDWEAIIVDDGSTDGTSQLIEAYAARQPRFRVVHKPNGGVSSALNAGLRRARGRWIHWLSSDDMFEPDKLAINRRWIDDNPQTKFFFSYFSLMYDDTGKLEKRDLWCPAPQSAHQLLQLLYRNYVNGISICVNRQAWQEVGFFNERFYYAQDYDQWLRILGSGAGIFIPEWTVISRVHSGQGSVIFADACSFDSAKAALEFLNQRRFPELVPWADLSQPDAAAAAVEQALDVACKPDAFLYALGLHPGLFLRLLEWVSDEHEGCPAKATLRAAVVERVRSEALRDGDNDWLWMLRCLAAATGSPGACFSYAAIDPVALARREYAIRRAGRGGPEAPLRTYLSRFEGIHESPDPPPGTGSDKIVLFLPAPEPVLSGVAELASLGHRPVVFTPLETAYRFDPSAPLIRRADADHDCLPWLGEVELVVTAGGQPAPGWIDARAEISIAEKPSRVSADIAKRILAELDIRSGSQPRRTVVFLQRVLRGGGAEQVVSDVARHLDRHRYLPIVLTLFDVEDHHLDMQEVPTFCVRDFTYDDPNICFRDAPQDTGERSAPALPSDIAELRSRMLSVVPSYWLAADGLHNLLDNLGPDTAVVTVMEEAAVTAWVAQMRGRFPYLASIHTVESCYFPWRYPDPAQAAVEAWAFRSACEGAARIVSMSAACVADLGRAFGIAADRSTVIWCPSNCARVRRLAWSLDAESDAVARRHRYVFVHLGRLSPEKDHDLLLQAATLLREEHDDFVIICIGNGGERSRLEAEIERLALAEHVLFVGERKNPFPMIARAAALVLTSKFEGFGLVLPEAMACGTPVISTDCAGGPREVLRDGECGLLVPDGDPRALSEAMWRTATDATLRHRLIEAGFARCEDFAPRAVARQWEAAIDQYLTSNAREPAPFSP